MTPNIVKGSNSLPKDRFDDPNHPRNNPAYQPNTTSGSSSSNNSNNMSDSIDAKNKATGIGSSSLSGEMDGDHSAKSMDAGASAATNVTDLADGIHEDSRSKVAAGVKETGHGTSIFSKDGAVGSAFTKDGAIGGTAHSIGGPLAADGAIGKHFNADGAIGGTFQQLAKKNEQH